MACNSNYFGLQNILKASSVKTENTYFNNKHNTMYSFFNIIKKNKNKDI